MIDRLRQELRDLTDSTLLLAGECDFRRIHDRTRRVATALVPTVAQEAAASANHDRLVRWHDAVSSVLHRRGIATPDLGRTVDELSTLVLLQRRDVGRITRPQWQRDFVKALQRAGTQLDRVLTEHAPAFVFPRVCPRPQHVFRLQIESGRGTRWRVHASALGLEAEEIIAAPFTRDALETFFEWHCQPDTGDPALALVSTMDSIRAFGRRLYQALFSGCVGLLYEKVRQDAAGRAHDVRIDISALGHECRAVPWEALHDDVRFLSLSGEMFVTRAIGRSRYDASSALPHPLRILLTISSPQGVDIIDEQSARRTIAIALAPLITLGLVELEVSANGSIDGMRRRLRAAQDEGRPHHVWHFIGHGEYDREAGRDELVMWRKGGEDHRVTTSELAAVLSEHPELRLVVLNACREGNDVRDRSWEAAATIIDAGVRAVVAMQFELSYDAAAVIDAELYGSIVDGASVDQALGAVRRALVDTPDDSGWLAPVLFHGVSEGAF